MRTRSLPQSLWNELPRLLSLQMIQTHILRRFTLVHTDELPSSPFIRLGRPKHLRSELTNICASTHSSRHIVFSLPEDVWAGGFGDRLLGLVTTHYLAIMTTSALYVNWTRPYNLRTYFDVHDCAVVDRSNRAPRPPHTSKTVNTVDNWHYFQNGTFVMDETTDINIFSNGRHWLDIVTTSRLSSRARLLGLDSFSRQQLFKRSVDALLTPKRHVLSAVSAVLVKLSEIDGSRRQFSSSRTWYVGVQIRCGSHGVLSWSDPTRHSLSDVPCFVNAVLDACAGRKRCPVFLTADSQTAADAFRKELASRRQPGVAVVEADGPILHTDRTNATSAAATGATDPWLRSIVDWWLLKHASVLVISRSGFGETAAWASSTAAAARRVELGTPGQCRLKAFDTHSEF